MSMYRIVGTINVFGAMLALSNDYGVPIENFFSWKDFFSWISKKNYHLIGTTVYRDM